VTGRAWKFGDNISTDLIAAGRYYHLRSNLPELAKHVLEDARKEFAEQVRTGDFVVGGRNFGKGSSREHAPLIIKIAGTRAVLAIDLERGIVHDRTKKVELKFPPLPPVMARILEEGGLVEYIKRHGDLVIAGT